MSNAIVSALQLCRRAVAPMSSRFTIQRGTLYHEVVGDHVRRRRSRVEHHKKLAILVGGGPAPGINSVIGAATIRAALEGMDVVGVRDGFSGLMHGDIEHVMPLTIDVVSRINFRGGSYIGIARANPTSDPKYLENV